ncbi:MAG: hypothetical protein LH654_10765 [Thermoleophilia bacterium]|nr:hypothetical protein [Thermoleophilia bacterium]
MARRTAFGRRLRAPVAGVSAWAIVVLGIAAVALIPWSITLTAALPEHYVVHHWDIAWAGFDAGLAALLLATVVAALRQSRWLSSLALAAAATLVCDAWFDVSTSGSNFEMWLAFAGAVVVEVPLAVLCVVVSRRALPGGGERSASSRP